MTTTERLLNAPGQLTLGTRSVSVAALSVRGERALIAELGSLIGQAVDAYRRAKPLLEKLVEEKNYGLHATVAKALADAVVKGEQPSYEAVDEARRTQPKVLACEIYRRAKPFHPALSREEIEAVITDSNVADVYFDLEVALGYADGDPKPTPSALPAGS